MEHIGSSAVVERVKVHANEIVSRRLFSFGQVSSNLLWLSVVADEDHVQGLAIARQIRHRPFAGGLSIARLTLEEVVDAQGANRGSVDEEVFQPRRLLDFGHDE